MASYGLVQIRYKRDRPGGEPAEDVMVNALHCQVSDGGWSTDDRDTFVTAFGVFWAAVQAAFSSQVGPTEIRFYNMPGVAGPVGDPVYVNTDASRVGTGAPDATLPPQASITITHQTSNRRRWGRIYFGGLVSATLHNGRFLGDWLFTFISTWDTFLTTLRINGQGLVVWHRSSWTPMDVVTISMDDVWDVQRRRRYDHALNRLERSLTD